MFRNLPYISSKLREELRERLFAEVQLFEIDVEAVDVALILVKPTRRAVNKPGGIQLFQFIISFVCTELPPAFIKDRPQADAGMVFQCCNGSLHGFQKFFPGIGISMHTAVISFLEMQSRENRIPQITVIPVVDHILKDNHPQPVTVVIEQLRLNLDVLTQHVKAKCLHRQNILFKSLCIGRRIKAVTPISLIQQAVEEIRLSVQAKTRNPVDRLHRQRTKGKIALHPIFSGYNCKVIQIRCFRAPPLRLLQCEVYFPVMDCVFLPIHQQRAVFDAFCRNFRPVFPGADFDAGYILQRHRLQPHRLPDAGTGCIPHTSPVSALLPPGILQGKVIEGADFKAVAAFTQNIRYFRRKRQISVLGTAYFPAVNQHNSVTAHSSEMEQDPLSLPLSGNRKSLAVKKKITGFRRHFHSGQKAFRTKRYNNLFLAGFRRKDTRFSDFQLPFPIQTEPVFSHHLRSRIDLPWNLRKVFSLFCIHSLHTFLPT